MTRPYHHGHLRGALLDAAFQLLDTHSAGQISLREIARQAGVSHAAPYHYFPDRTQLMAALAEKCNEQFYQAQLKAVQRVQAPDGQAERLLALGEAYVQFAVQHPNAFSLIYDPEFCPVGKHQGATSDIIQANHDLLTQTIQNTQDAGHLTGQDPVILSAALWGTVHGLAHLVLLGHLSADIVPTTLRVLIPSLEQR